MTTYQYQKLTESDAIRLILLQPSTDLDSPLVCTLLYTSLTHCHNNLIDKYTALSYVWGDAARSRLIKVNNEAMYITASLDSALRHLRDRHRPRLVWADAICIDQDDPEERNQQVNQMGWVYRQANHTVIYLGEGTPETRLFLETLQSKSPVDWKPPHLRRGSIERVRDELGSEVEVAAREWIVGRPWFKRVWILQELVLSQDPWIQCGTSATGWTCLYSHVFDISLKRLLKPEERIVHSMGRLHLQHRSLEWDKNETAENETPWFAERLYDLLKSRKGFGVTDPRDMLFANLGLVGHATEYENEFLHLIMVDYQKNEAKVYSDLARYFLESFDDFRIFALLDPNEKRCESEAPSWAPDWVSGPPSQYSRLSDELKYNQYSYDWKTLTWASQSRVLVFGGRFLGEVQALGPIIDQSLCPQIARDFSELLKRDRVLDRDLCQFMKSAFEQPYQKWRQWLVPWIPDPKRILKWIQEQCTNEKDWLKRGVTSDWLIDSEMDDQEILIALDIESILFALADINKVRLSDADIRYLSEEPWSWSGEIHPRRGHSSWRIRSLMAQLVFSSFITDGPNLFYSRRIARLGNNLLALVPGSTRIGDIVSLPIQDFYPVPLVLRHNLAQIDGDLDVEIRQRIDDVLREDLSWEARENLDQLRGAEVIQHLTIVGECFVEGWMHGPRYTKGEAGPLQILALH
ncbi:HET-domain-containing protein [Hyaloscypha bicolor E]|uniref:HET-domain-containing protein n=1 Tax=Hyaloscypha bicolor E TaxID=1095630 RepID=A0A2J6STD4_9HELO|nr:HET-domain-containing protein [Hyaloscypha bicolor E]PMD54007.1 HET-domain-containing protein [Hyaloscypha bicolor E]